MTKTPCEAGIADYNANFKTKWDKVFAQFNASSNSGKVWIAGPSAYLFDLGNVKFATDLQIRRSEDLELVRDELVEQTKNLSFVLITHQHDDHMCLPLMNALKDTSIRWYIPKGVPQHLIDESGLHAENITYVSDGDIITAGDLTIKVFDSPHVRKEDSGTFVQCGYQIISPDSTILMPGDVRNYEYNQYPDFGNVDICFSHVWAGDNSLDKEKFIPMLNEFAEFNAKFNAKKYIFGHLYEIARGDLNMWNYTHAGMAMDKMYALMPNSDFEFARPGCWFDLVCSDSN